MKEFVAYVKQNGDKVKQAHGGIGASSHMACLLFNAELGLKPTLVAYRGTGPGGERPGRRPRRFPVRAVGERGRADQGRQREGLRRSRLRSAWRRCPMSRPPRRPGVKYDMSIWAGIFAPKGTPKEVVDKLAAALDKALDDPAVQKRLGDLGALDPAKAERNPATFDRLVKAEIARWAPILKAASASTQNGAARSQRDRGGPRAQTSVAGRGAGHGLVVGRAGRRRQALDRVRDRRLLHAAPKTSARAFAAKYGCRAPPATRRSSRTPRSRRSSTPRPTTCISRPPGMAADAGKHVFLDKPIANTVARRPRDRAHLREGRHRARARLSAPPREPFPLDQGRDRRRPLRQAGAGGRQYQPRPARQDRPLLVALSRPPACRAASCCRSASTMSTCWRCLMGPVKRVSGMLGPAGAAGRQSRRRQSHPRARERRDLQPDRVLCVGVRVLHDERLRQGSERLLRPVLRPAASQARRDQGAADRDREATTRFARSSRSSSHCVRDRQRSRRPTASGRRATSPSSRPGVKSAREGRAVDVADIMASGE